MSEGEWYEPALVVRSKKVKGFAECSKCGGILYPLWAAEHRAWNYCPLCGRELRKGVQDGEDVAKD